MRKTRPQCGLMLENSAGEILLQLRDDKPSLPFADCWGTFGGQIEPGESPEQAIRREIREELGYELHDPQRYDVYHYDGYDIYMFREVDPLVSLETLQIHEGQAGAFFGPEALNSLRFAFNAQEIMRDYFRRFKP